MVYKTLWDLTGLGLELWKLVFVLLVVVLVWELEYLLKVILVLDRVLVIGDGVIG